MDMGESIYNLVPQPVQVPQKEPLYRSKHPHDLPPTFSTFGIAGTSKPGYSNVAGTREQPSTKLPFKKDYSTFGKPGAGVKAPSEVTLKGTGRGGGAVELPAKVEKFSYADPVPRKPELPSKKELTEHQKSMKQTKEPKNFVTANAVENILSVPPREPEPIDWTKKPSFGKVPNYIKKIKSDIAREYDYIRTMQEAEVDAAPAGMRKLEDNEREELVRQLKGKWDEINVAYQKTSVLNLNSLDTIGKVKRKEQYEAQLAQIERDIEKLSKKVVYVTLDE
eukprot:scaffold55346_cov30-Tisochrysis_lutea.AAC.1